MIVSSPEKFIFYSDLGEIMDMTESSKIPFVWEWRKIARTIVAACAFFFLMSSYYIIKPTRVPILLAYFDSKHLYKFYALATLITMVGVFFYNYIVGRYPRTQALRIFFLITVPTFMGFWLLFHLSMHARWVAVTYFFFASVYILFFTALFWSFNHDIHQSDEAEIFYSYINLGAQIGVIIGSKIAYGYAARLGSENLILITIGGLFLCWVFLELLNNFDPHRQESRYAKPEETGSLQDLKMFVANPYVLGIGLLVFLAAFGATICDIQYNVLLVQSLPGKDAQSAFGASVNFYMGVCNVAMAFLITPLLLRFLGPALPICIYPLILLVDAIVLLSGVSIYTFFYLLVATLSLRYTLYDVGKEVFYVPTDKTTKYKMKALCDTFIFRVGDTAASGATGLYNILVTTWLFGVSFVVVFLVPLWIPVIFILGREYRKRCGKV